jgi:HEAT repeat protein
LALKKNTQSKSVEFDTCFSLEDCVNKLSHIENKEDRHSIFDSLMNLDNGPAKLVSILSDGSLDQVDSGYIIALLSSMDKSNAPIDDVLELLASEDAFIRNGAISILRDYGEQIIYFIVKSLLSDDKDVRILALNVLGDVNFKESRDLMVDLLEKEEDLNVSMTAVDYLSEIGLPEDISLLESLKNRFDNDAYVVFAVDRAISCIKDNN